MAPPEVVDIDSEGDVVLICGSVENEVRLRVSSAVLARASPVFKALLSPRFQEGTALATHQRVEVPLPDDVGKDVQVVCSTIHCRNDMVPDSLAVAEISAIAVLVDKYDCAIAMQYMGRIWIQPHLQTAKISELKELMSAAIVFNDEYLFNEVCKAVLWRSEGTIATPKDSAMLSLQSALVHLERQRRIKLDSITGEIESAIAWLAETQCSNSQCTLAGVAVCQYISRLSSQDLYGVPGREEQSIEQLIFKLSGFDYKLPCLAQAPACGKECRELYQMAYLYLDLSRQTKHAEMALPCFRCACDTEIIIENECEHG